ncbi:MAG TPA: hypothetical protein VFT81_02160 [Dermatophilaceae bacterium]|nr:hypothetical protein [Dermatophilaceae bacterium]
MPAERPAATLSRSLKPGERPRRSRARGRIALLSVLAVVGTAGWFGATELIDALRSPQCTVTAAGASETFDPEQAGNAALITALAVKRGMPPRAATIALTTAYQESKILNITYGDRDSLGLFQQRPSQGWGTEEQILDPVYSTNKFYDALVKLKGYEDADITEIAQKVQRSAHPELYRDHEGQGRVLASALTGHSPAGLTCRLDDHPEGKAPATPATLSTVRADLATQMGVTTAVQSEQSERTLTVTAPDVRIAWAVGHWAVARAEQYGATEVRVGDRAWDRTDGDEGWSAGTASRTVLITLG